MTSTVRKTLDISIIIPALNEAGNIARTLRAAAVPGIKEIIVVDGGSTDDTMTIAQDNGAIIHRSPAGRARQMNHGAEAARGGIFLFLHADTLLPPDFQHHIMRIMRQPNTAAGAFRFAMDRRGRGNRLVEVGTNLRTRLLQLPYGDQAIFVSSVLFKKAGGYASQPILEDVLLIKALKKYGRIRIAPVAAITSDRRWQRLGLFKTTLINQAIMAGYLLGLPPQLLKGWYRIGKK
ncbi:MAG TPA: glycosyltransferase [Desulfobacterales bacterium]|nr:glycosyltransferase [Desulfobacterales bacterium]